MNTLKLQYIFLFIACSHLTIAQNKFYTISGQIKNVNSGKIYMMSIGSKSAYYNNNRVFDSADIHYGSFKIIRLVQDLNPYPFVFRIRNGSMEAETGFVFIEPKSQVVLIDSINKYIAPVIKKSAIQNELKHQYEPFFKEVALKATKLEEEYFSLAKKYNNNIPAEDMLQLSGSLQSIRVIGDSLLSVYSKNHPNSYVTLWKLIDRFSNNGFKILYAEIFEQLSETIKSTIPAQLFSNDLNEAKSLKVNSFFPNLKLKDFSQKDIILNVHSNKTEYTLVDFWFSRCAPCLLEFPKYNNLYSIFTNQQFKIIGISVDITEDFANWQKVIREKKLKWESNYWDENGEISTKLSIHAFPTNFLLDKEGRIIRTNMTPDELEDFLTDDMMRHIYFNSPYEPK
jgi:thiol-disulfide isomerase/thioredoxin